MALAHHSHSKKHATYKDPKGGLTAAGREHFKKVEGSHLKPGVKGRADTPEKMRRKGSFLRRHFANPRGPMMKDGKPTRLALSAHAWGEPVPKNGGGGEEVSGQRRESFEALSGDEDEALMCERRAGASRCAGRARAALCAGSLSFALRLAEGVRWGFGPPALVAFRDRRVRRP